MPFIHPSSEIQPGAVIGKNTKIWHSCLIRSGARIGSECTLGSGVYVSLGARIGDRVKIANYANVGAGVTLEDGVFVGPHVTLVDDRVPRAVNADMSVKTRDNWTQGQTIVCQGASIGANATILCGIKIGRWAMVGAGSVVTGNIPDFAKAVGVPARVVGFVCRCGEPIQTAAEATLCPEGSHCRLHPSL
jgi:UDP-2-acetamido-3-amino-2,3-dideoxy-glucuronate N-acetyltransferase